MVKVSVVKKGRIMSLQQVPVGEGRAAGHPHSAEQKKDEILEHPGHDVPNDARHMVLQGHRKSLRI